MKFGLLLSTLVFLFSYASAYAAEITHFDTDLRLDVSGILHVVESITYDFGTEQKHGIFRTIPVRYQSSGEYKNIDINIIGVVDEYGNGYKYQISQNNDIVTIKIGDPNKTITGAHTYILSYQVEDAVVFFDDHDEIYWNVTGDRWVVPITTVSGSFILDADGSHIEQSTCYRGEYGDTDTCASHTSGSNEREILFSEQAIAPGEGVTLAIGFPKGVVAEPSVSNTTLKLFLDNLILFAPLLVFLVMWAWWYRRGRDPKGRVAIVPQYEAPEDLSPMEVGTLFDEYVSHKDFSAEIVYLATRGYLKVHQIEREALIFTDIDYVLEPLQDADDELNELQRELLDALFATEHTKHYILDEEEFDGVALSDLKHEFVDEYQKMSKQVYDDLELEGLFYKNPSKVRMITIGLGLATVVLVWVVYALLFNEFTWKWAIALGISALFVVGFGLIMPARSKQGVLKREYILGLKEYLTVAEKDRLAFHNSPERTPERFDALLPYAMVLGVERAWAKEFEDIYTEQPTWYATAHGGAFNTTLFASDLKAFTNATSSATTSQSSSRGASSGGGFSGGGAGGGGGGSW